MINVYGLQGGHRVVGQIAGQFGTWESDLRLLYTPLREAIRDLAQPSCPNAPWYPACLAKLALTSDTGDPSRRRTVGQGLVWSGDEGYCGRGGRTNAGGVLAFAGIDCGRASTICRPRHHSTVRLFARFLGLSTSVPRLKAGWSASNGTGIACTSGEDSWRRTGINRSPPQASFHGDAFRQISWFIDIGAASEGGVIGE